MCVLVGLPSMCSCRWKWSFNFLSSRHMLPDSCWMEKKNPLIIRCIISEGRMPESHTSALLMFSLEFLSLYVNALTELQSLNHMAVIWRYAETVGSGGGPFRTSKLFNRLELWVMWFHWGLCLCCVAIFPRTLTLFRRSLIWRQIALVELHLSAWWGRGLLWHSAKFEDTSAGAPLVSPHTHTLL